MKHTKGKLEANGNEIYANNGRTFIAEMFDENENVKGDTQRVIKAWNNFDKLLEVHKDNIRFFKRWVELLEGERFANQQELLQEIKDSISHTEREINKAE